jgi:hypothetical protein
MREPHGHRGHPTFSETLRARTLGQSVGVLIAQLESEGFTHEESVAFLAGAAYEYARSQGESWAAYAHAIRTVADLVAGVAAAKTWSMNCIEHAMRVIREELL